MIRASRQCRSLEVFILSTVLATIPACSANAGFKRKSQVEPSSPVVTAPPAGRIAYRPPGYSWWNRPRQFYIQGYAGSNYDLQTRTNLRETRYLRRAQSETRGN